MNSEMSKEYKQYVDGLETKLEYLYTISRKARKKGLDPALEPECKGAKDLADLVEGLVGPKGVAGSIRELSTKLPREELAFKIAEQIVYGKFGHMEPEAAAEQAIRTALAILTEGLTAAPLQGVAKVKIKTNRDRSKYLAVYFAGPIRSAGGTDQALTLVIGDFVRRLLGLDRYKPTEDEIARFIEEVRLYERSVTGFQYHVSDEELRRPLQWLPVEVTGTESDPIEVSSFRNLPRIETNRVRGGALRVVNDGIVGRSAKVWAIIEKLGIQGWDWLKEFRQVSGKKRKLAGFMKDVIAGRPVFSFPSRRGGFRLRYGRARNTGLAAVGVHPATMSVLNGFLAAGTQLRLELPGKGGVVVPVDTIESPIVKLQDGSIIRVSVKNFSEIKRKIKKILFLGDILISFGDFLYNSKPIGPSGYVEEWWVEDLKKTIMEKFDGDSRKAANAAKIPLERLKSLLKNPFSYKPKCREAIALSTILQVPLHPSYTFFWTALSSVEELERLRGWLVNSEIRCEKSFVQRIVGEMDSNVKEALEKICLPHKVLDGKIVVEEYAHTFAYCLGYDTSGLDFSSAESVLEAVQMLSGVPVKRKAPTFVGARMGRPEKAKRREMRPLVHVLFPVGLAGGSRRNVAKAAKRESASVQVVKRNCPICNSNTFRIKCPKCGVETVPEKVCPRCGRSLKGDLCPVCRVSARSYARQPVNFKELLETACSHLGVSVPKMLKGVKGLINESKTPEIMDKGVLRAKHDLSVYKDGTIRFDCTNAPLTHFKPSEVGVSVEKLKELGYTHDVDGMPLKNKDQMCELKVQDVVVPWGCADYFMRVAGFVDELLTKVYGLVPYYNAEGEADLVGSLVVGLAPHTSVGILGRIIGFTGMNVCYAHPVWHSAKRRDCDGDEDALMLALDTLLNFSRVYLPAQIGGIMDAPLLLIPVVDTQEVQRQVHDFDVADAYPVDFYEESLGNVEAKHISRLIDLVEYRLGSEAQFEGFGYTTPVSDINMGNAKSSYKRFKSMVEKLDSQLNLAEKIEAVDAKKVALKVLTTHFIRDIAGNLRAFSTQGFRCKSCNRRFRRLPLRGKCSSCGGPLTLTVYRGGIEKYLDAAQKLIEKYGLPEYYAQRLMLVRDEIHSLFEGGKPKQISLVDFV